MLPGLDRWSRASTSSLPKVLRSSTIVHAGNSDGVGAAASARHVVAPPDCWSCHLLYSSWTVQVFGPTVMEPDCPLQMSPVSFPVASSNHAFKFGSETISSNWWLVTWVCRCSRVWPRCSEQEPSLAQEF